MSATPKEFPGLEFLSTAVMLLDEHDAIRYINPAAENLFEFSNQHVRGLKLGRVFSDAGSLFENIRHALLSNVSYAGDATLVTAHPRTLHVHYIVTPVDAGFCRSIIEFRKIDQQLKVAREERMLHQQQANRELIRNLAHEIRNPLGGLRGAAQLLERELDRPDLCEYTQVIIKEADRLQSLMDRLLTPHRLPQIGKVNIHEVLERVRSVLDAEYKNGLTIHRDYDISLPSMTGDKEQLIQAVLNIARNAAQATDGRGELILRTRIARQVTLAKIRHKLALMIQIIDNGPGIPEIIRERMFYPLVSGRDGGSGLGLMIAQTYVAQHQGTIECDSRPGYTCFTLLLPQVRREAPTTQ